MTAKDKMIENYIYNEGMTAEEAQEAYTNFMRSIASKGGKKSGGTNWQRNPALASQAASKGGSLGRRGWKYRGIINGNHVWVNSSTGVTDTRPA